MSRARVVGVMVLAGAGLAATPALAGAQNAQSAVFSNPQWVFDPSGNNLTRGAYACGITGEPCSDEKVVAKQADYLCRTVQLLSGTNPDGTPRQLWVRTGGPALRYARANLAKTTYRPVGQSEFWYGHNFRGLDKSGKGSEFGPAEVFTQVACENASLGGAGYDVRSRFQVTLTRRLPPKPNRQGQTQLVRLNARGVFIGVTGWASSVATIEGRGGRVVLQRGTNPAFSGSMRLTHVFRLCRDRLCRLGPLRERVVWLRARSKGSQGRLFHPRPRGGQDEWSGNLNLAVTVARSRLGGGCRRGAAGKVFVVHAEGVGDRLRLRYCGALLDNRTDKPNRGKAKVTLRVRGGAANPGLV